MLYCHLYTTVMNTFRCFISEEKLWLDSNYTVHHLSSICWQKPNEMYGLSPSLSVQWSHRLLGMEPPGLNRHSREKGGEEVLAGKTRKAEVEVEETGWCHAYFTLRSVTLLKIGKCPLCSVFSSYCLQSHKQGQFLKYRAAHFCCTFYQVEISCT